MDDPPIFTAISTSARQLYLLLRCISFTLRAEVEIRPDGLRFTAEEARITQGVVFLEETLFSSFTFTPPADQPFLPSFQVSLPALLETLQIFGIPESSSSYRHHNGGFSSSYATAFNTPALALGGTCKISYLKVGAPLSITISEAGVTTTCDLTTYEPSPNHDEDIGVIPFNKDELTIRIIMRSTWLHDAIVELSGMNPTVLILNTSSSSAPYFTLEGHGGPFGDSKVDFTPDSTNEQSSRTARSKKQPLITDTFDVSAPSGTRGRIKQRYKFELIKKAGRAMALASKVSLRQDRQGVLSMQFMIEVGEGGVGGSRDYKNNNSTADSATPLAAAIAKGQFSFVDFRFVPLVDDDEDNDELYTNEYGGSMGSDD